MRYNLRNSKEARTFVEEKFMHKPSRLRHILKVAELAEKVSRAISDNNPGLNLDTELTVCAALLHDIGYIKEARESDFHPLDGYNYLVEEGYPEIAELIVGHSSAPEQAELMGLGALPDSEAIAADIITYCDLHVKQGGEVVSYAERLKDIISRHGEESLAARAHKAARSRLENLIKEIEELSGVSVIAEQAA